MIYNIPRYAFGYMGTRNGDLIAICNIIEWMRKKYNDPSLQFYLTPGILNPDQHIKKFFKFLCENTDYFSLNPGNKTANFNNIAVFDFRDIAGDLVKIKNTRVQEKKVVIFPLYDAAYNEQRNWSMEIMERILKECLEVYPNHKRYICAKNLPPPGLIDTTGYEVSTDFITNIEHIMTAEIFYGGDTGVSHFASVLDPGPKELNYVYSSRCLIHTLPFYFTTEHKGNLIKFWLDFFGETRYEL